MTLEIDGSGSNVQGSGGPSITVGLTTSQAKDVILAFIQANLTGGDTQVASITDTAGLSWTRRGGSILDGQYVMEEWYALAASALSSDTITISFAHATTFTAVSVFGVSGANFTSPFAGSPFTGLSGDPVFSSPANAMVIGGLRFGSTPLPSAGSGWTQISADGGSYTLTESETSQTDQTGVTMAVGDGSGNENGWVVDAIVPASGTAKAISAALAAVLAPAATAHRSRANTAALAAALAPVATTHRSRANTAALAATLAPTATPARSRPLTAPLTTAGTLAASPARARALVSPLAGSGAVTATISRSRANTLAATLTAAGTLSAGPARTRHVAAALVASGLLGPTSARSRAVAVAFAASGALTARTARTRHIAAALAASGLLGPTSARSRAIVAALAASGVLRATLTGTRVPSAVGWQPFLISGAAANLVPGDSMLRGLNVTWAGGSANPPSINAMEIIGSDVLVWVYGGNPGISYTATCTLTTGRGVMLQTTAPYVAVGGW